MTLKKETTAKIIDLINSGKRLTITELPDGSAEVTWDLEDSDVEEIVQLEWPGTTDIEEKFHTLFKGLVNESLEKAKRDLNSGSNT